MSLGWISKRLNLFPYKTEKASLDKYYKTTSVLINHKNIALNKTGALVKNQWQTTPFYFLLDVFTLCGHDKTIFYAPSSESFEIQST